MIGIVLQLEGLQALAIAMYAVVLVFQLVTLPVEFNASHRAMDYLSGVGVVSAERKGAFNVLRACAFDLCGRGTHLRAAAFVAFKPARRIAAMERWEENLKRARSAARAAEGPNGRNFS